MILANKLASPLSLAFGLLVVLSCYAPNPSPISEGTVTPEASAAPVSVRVAPVNAADTACANTFLPHDLNHVTTVPGGQVEQFEANGGGVALGDLDGDGDLDIVLTNHDEPNTILWNEGNLTFRAERFPPGDSRAAALIDVDGDGRLDIVITRRTGALQYYRNQGQNQFVQEFLAGIARPAYAMNWGDLDQDGDLDLVTGSYDASLLADLGSTFLLGSGAGVFVYENQAGAFYGQRLADSAQAMSIVLFDANDDGWLDIVVGNDFAVPDYLWLRTERGWQAASFDTTSYSTMSLEVGDVNNDGQLELFSTDMKPYSETPEVVAAWEPLLADMDEGHEPGDAQVMANVLQMQTELLGFQDTADARNLDATGWSWSAKFGDLDQDGLLDLYVVNGMAEATLFAHLPGGELVEENQVLRNIGQGYYRVRPDWNLGSTRGGRGMSMGDLDSDGDLDIVVNNLRGPAQLFENRLCGGASLQVDLRWPGSGNTQALGAQVTLFTQEGAYLRDVRAASGYISGDPPRLHFGFPAAETPERLEIRWPDGSLSRVANVAADTLMVVTRDRS